MKPRKSHMSRTPKKPVLILCLLFGIFGIHRFYLQRFRSATFQLVTLGGLGVWAIRDFCKIWSGNFKDARGYRIQR